MRIAVGIFLITALAGPVGAQPSTLPAPTDSITVTGAKEAAIAKFVETRAAVSRIAGKIGRWEAGICPIAYGIPPAYGKFVTDRVKDIALQSGVRVDEKETCGGNIQIIFTTTPQALMDNIRKEHPVYLGYHDNSTQAEQMTTLKRPVHAFYTTQTRDFKGRSRIDTTRCRGEGSTLNLPAPPSTGPIPDSSNGMRTMDLGCANIMAASGFRIGDGISSEFAHIVIVVNTPKVVDLEMGSLSDYIAMLAMSQPVRFDACQDLPSITNLMIDPACAGSTVATVISAHDLAYLKGLYKMTAGRSLGLQKGEISYRMRQAQSGEGKAEIECREAKSTSRLGGKRECHTPAEWDARDTGGRGR